MDKKDLLPLMSVAAVIFASALTVPAAFAQNQTGAAESCPLKYSMVDGVCQIDEVKKYKFGNILLEMYNEYQKSASSGASGASGSSGPAEQMVSIVIAFETDDCTLPEDFGIVDKGLCSTNYEGARMGVLIPVASLYDVAALDNVTGLYPDTRHDTTELSMFPSSVGMEPTISDSSVGMSVVQLSYSDYPPPLKQVRDWGVSPEDVQCNAGLVHAVRANGAHVCVKETTAERLGWEIFADKEAAPAEAAESCPLEYSMVDGVCTVDEVKKKFATILLKQYNEHMESAGSGTSGASGSSGSAEQIVAIAILFDGDDCSLPEDLGIVRKGPCDTYHANAVMGAVIPVANMYDVAALDQVAGIYPDGIIDDEGLSEPASDVDDELTMDDPSTTEQCPLEYSMVDGVCTVDEVKKKFATILLKQYAEHMESAGSGASGASGSGGSAEQLVVIVILFDGDDCNLPEDLGIVDKGPCNTNYENALMGVRLPIANMYDVAALDQVAGISPDGEADPG